MAATTDTRAQIDGDCPAVPLVVPVVCDPSVPAGVPVVVPGALPLSVGAGGAQETPASAVAMLLAAFESMGPEPVSETVTVFLMPSHIWAVTAVCAFATQGCAFVALPFYFQHTMGLTAVATGLLITPWPLVVGMMGPIAGRLSDRFPVGILGGIGLAVLAAGMALMATLPADASVANIVWRMAVCGMGFGFFQSPNMRALLTSVPPARSGGGSGIAATARLTGQMDHGVHTDHRLLHRC